MELWNRFEAALKKNKWALVGDMGYPKEMVGFSVFQRGDDFAILFFDRDQEVCLSLAKTKITIDGAEGGMLA